MSIPAPFVRHGRQEDTMLHFALSLILVLAQTGHTLRLAEGASPAAATIDEMSWLAGRWTGTGLGGETEETWSPPMAGEMVGTFRLVRAGKPVFYEFMRLSVTDRGLAMQLKHFSPDMKGWEEREKFVEFRYLKTEGKTVYFEGLTFRRDSDSELTIFLALKSRDGQVREETFRMTRR
jgi:hypothetical protein